MEHNLNITFLLILFAAAQASAYEKQGRATIACLVTKFRLQTCEKSHATYQVGVWWHTMIIPFRSQRFLEQFSYMKYCL